MEPLAHLLIEDVPLGRYTARVDVVGLDSDGERFARVEVTLDELYGIRLHVDNAIRSLEARRLVDAIAGPCSLCGNSRMISEVRHGSPWTEHCPTCRPKIDAALAALANGLAKGILG